MVYHVINKFLNYYNCSLKNKAGAHERIFNALACDALVLTYENCYLKKYFKDGESILFYSPIHLEEVSDKIKTYLLDKEKYFQIVQKGKEIVKQFHTRDERVIEIKKKIFNFYVSYHFSA